MDYKDTLNLPRTDFPMKADLVTREPQRLEKWQAANLYGKIQEARAGAEKFVLHDGPPFANGDVHIGTALNKILKDIIIKYQTLRGKNAPYVPGWDCHGLPIEFKVSQEMRKAGDTTADAATIRKACDAYARKYIDLQRTQFKRLGVLGDWENPYLTLNKEYEAEELRLFADIVEKGFVYRGKKPVYWSIPARTALAEAEVEYKDHVSQSIYVKFPVVGQSGVNIVIWTTTPWTLPANLAVAYNSTFDYTQVMVNPAEGGQPAECFIVSTALLSSVAEKCGWFSYEIVRNLTGDQLAQFEYQHPFCNRTGKLFAGDDFVENSTGSGFVHIAPGHGLEDYGVGLRNGLPIYSPVDDDGALAYTSDLPKEQQMPAEMIGKSILEKHGKSDANEAVLHELRVRKALLKQENYHHSYPHCWRSKTPVIFRAMDQWFIRIDNDAAHLLEQAKQIGKPLSYAESFKKVLGMEGKNFRELALDAINAVNWIPDWGKNRIEGAVKSRPDWCISRQRSWGVPIPVFVGKTGGPIADGYGNCDLNPDVIRNFADLVEKHGSNIWFEKSALELWPLVKPNNWLGEDAVGKGTDTLDVWIDSGSSSRSVLASRHELMREDVVVRALLENSVNTGEPGSAQERIPRYLLKRLNAGKLSDRLKGLLAHQEFADAPPLPTEAWQADMYLEGSDQHRGWFQSSLLLSLAGNGAPPYRTVLTHGFMVDADREKISKSKQGQGGYEKPQTAEAYVKKWGADVVRLWVASQDFRNDIVVSEERVNKVSETYRGLRNALRYQLSNLYDFDPAKHTVADADLTGLDRWILGEFAQLEAEARQAYDAFEFHVVYQKISQFAAVQLSSMYHDAVKDRLYTDAANSPRRRSTQTALHRLVTGLCELLSPILAFTADEAWEFIPGHAGVPSVHLATWQPTTLVRSEAERMAWQRLFEIRALALPSLEKERQAKTIGKSLDAKVTLTGSNPMLVDGKTHLEALRELLNVSQFEVHVTPGNGEPTLDIVVSKALGQKCERCWHWEEDVGAEPKHPTICGRCVDAVQQSGTAA